MDNTVIYEKFDWGKLQSNDLRDKINLVIDYIPEDVKTILDVGCGNGVITNELAKRYKVTGVDMLNLLISPKKPYWLFVLMKRK